LEQQNQNTQVADSTSRVGSASTAPDWYERRHELDPGMVFQAIGGVVQLHSRVPGDGTRWSVLDWDARGKCWLSYGNEVEPGDLSGEPIEDTPDAIAKALGEAA
jgi:hypothetical protein